VSDIGLFYWVCVESMRTSFTRCSLYRLTCHTWIWGLTKELLVIKKSVSAVSTIFCFLPNSFEQVVLNHHQIFSQCLYLISCKIKP